MMIVKRAGTVSALNDFRMARTKMSVPSKWRTTLSRRSMRTDASRVSTLMLSENRLT